MTTGQILFYGGIAGIVIFTLAFIISWASYEKKKKKLIKMIEEEHS